MHKWKKIILAAILGVLSFFMPNLVVTAIESGAESADYRAFYSIGSEILEIQEANIYARPKYISAMIGRIIIIVVICACVTAMIIHLFRKYPQDKKYFIPTLTFLIADNICVFLWVIFSLILFIKGEVGYHYVDTLADDGVMSNIFGWGIALNIAVLCLLPILYLTIFGRKKISKTTTLLNIICTLLPLIIFITSALSLSMGEPSVCCMPDNYEELVAQAKIAKPFYISVTRSGFMIYSIISCISFIVFNIKIFKIIRKKHKNEIIKFIPPYLLSLCNIVSLFLWACRIGLLNNIREYYPPGNSSITFRIAILNVILILCSWLIIGLIVGVSALVKIRRKK